MRRLLVSTLTIVVLLGWLQDAHAGGNDFQLNRLGSCGQTVSTIGRCQNGQDAQLGADVEAFKRFAKSFGQVLAPLALAPSNSLGLAGFAVAIESTIAVADSGDHWRVLDSRWQVDENNQVNPDTGAPVFPLLHLHLRKGLPLSFEIETTLSYLVDSQMMWLGGALKWSLVEAIHPFVPDLAIRGFGGSLIGAPDMSLTTAGMDIILSKELGAGGVVTLTPYAGVSLLWVIASSRVLDADPEFGDTPTGDYAPEFTFDSETQQVTRGLVGLQMVVTYVTLGVQFVSSGDVNTIGFHVGSDF